MTILYFAAIVILLFAFVSPEERRESEHPDISWWRQK